MCVTIDKTGTIVTKHKRKCKETKRNEKKRKATQLHNYTTQDNTRQE